MPASLASSLIELTKYTWEREKPMVLTGAMLDAASLSPAFGVSK
jgi:L-asparaginase/Glu-tRNA(Gln) amidotransferase subunit D